MNVLLGEQLKRFNRFYKEMDGIYHKLALRAGLSDSAFYVLYAIAVMGEGCQQKEIAEDYSISRQTINTSLKQLEEKGCLSLERGHGRDKRIYLTEAGRRMVEEKIEPVIEMENAAFAAMPPADSERLLALTERYVRLFEQQTRRKTRL